MSPEQCRGRAVDRRSDIFALGTILYELTTGAAPFAAESDLEILNQIAQGSARAADLARGARALPACAGGDRDARAGARCRRAVRDHARAAGRAGSVRARGGRGAVDGEPGRADADLSRPSWRPGTTRSARARRWATTWPRARRPPPPRPSGRPPTRSPQRQGDLRPASAARWGWRPSRRCSPWPARWSSGTVAEGQTDRRQSRPAPRCRARCERRRTPAAPPPAAAARLAASAPTPPHEPTTARRRARTAARVEAPPPQPPESRLRNWDPDSPRPP